MRHEARSDELPLLRLTSPDKYYWGHSVSSYRCWRLVAFAPPFAPRNIGSLQSPSAPIAKKKRKEKKQCLNFRFPIVYDRFAREIRSLGQKTANDTTFGQYLRTVEKGGSVNKVKKLKHKLIDSSEYIEAGLEITPMDIDKMRGFSVRKPLSRKLGAGFKFPERSPQKMSPTRMAVPGGSGHLDFASGGSSGDGGGWGGGGDEGFGLASRNMGGGKYYIDETNGVSDANGCVDHDAAVGGTKQL